METERTEDWLGGWTATDPVRIGFSWDPRNGGHWERNDLSGLQVREFGLANASDGALGVSHLRSTGSVPSQDWRANELDFDFTFVLRGSATVEKEDGEDVNLERWDTISIPKLLRHRLVDLSPDFEAVWIKAPAKFETYLGRETVLPGRPPSSSLIVTREAEESYVKGNGPREFFLYRDLGTRKPTNDRIHIHVVRATAPGAGTGWHYHTMAQWFMVIGGTSNIGVEDHDLQPLQEGDAMCVGYGPGMRHNVAPFSGDYAVLEMCVPAEYDTVPVDSPVGSAVM